ncbi:MAG: response regulator [Planctomycetes bacterium]|nr:response regulator [Planctomycetota bacterium]
MKRKVLVIDDEAVVRDTLGTFLRHRGYRVATAPDGLKGLELFRQDRPSIVFTDLRMPGSDGLDFLRKAMRIDPHAHIIFITGHGEEKDILDALHSGARNFFRKPLNFQEVIEALSALESRVMAEEGTRFEYAFVVSQDEALVIPNDLSVVSGVVNHITANLPHFFDEQTVHGIQGALIEMIVNAIEHGNLGISYEEKTRALENEKLADLISTKSQQPLLASRRVHIHYLFNAEEVRYTIEDEGDGFNIHDVPDPGHPDNLWLGHGRGILMTRALMDEVHYNEKGNRVTLVKRMPALGILPAF